jgi:uncharacterized repeat protein (TIGR01451 family)
MLNMPYLATEPPRSQPELSQTANIILPWSKVVFQSFRHNNWEIYVGNDDGSGQVRLTFHSAADMHPRFNRGTTRIVFASNRTGNFEIYTMNPDGSGLTRLTFTGADNVNPDWSPDGSKIAFESYRDGQAEIYVMNADGSNQTRLTTGGGFNGMPAWSPDGAKIAFSSGQSGGLRIWVMNANGTNQTQLSNQPNGVYPAWSPDGSRIAYSAEDPWQWLAVHRMNADGSNQQRIFSPGESATDAWVRGWSPDGQFITFTRISFVWHQGNWYWTNAYLDAVSATAWGHIIRLSNNNTDWHPHWQTTDNQPPTSSFHNLPAESPGPIPLSWSAFDTGGAGVRGYDVQVRTGLHGNWIDWLTNTPTLSSSYPGVGGQTYYFRARARDMAYNVEPWPVNAQAWTTVENQPPVSWISSLPAFRRVDNLVQWPNNLVVHWQGYDPGGSGIASFDVQYSEDSDDNWQDWQIETQQTSANFTGQAGTTYFFRTRATDRAQNQAAWPDGTDLPTTTFYTWGISGLATDNTGTPTAQVSTSAEPEALAVLSGNGSHASYFGGDGPYSLAWEKDGYGSLPATNFTITVGNGIKHDNHRNLVMPPADNIVADWGFESGGFAADDWVSSGTLPAAIDYAARHTGQHGLRLGPSSLLAEPLDMSVSEGLDRYPQVAIDQQNNIHVVWQVGVGSNVELVYRYRDGSDGTWSAVQSLSEPAWIYEDYQLVVGNDGVVHVVWTESITDPSYIHALFYTRRNVNGSWSNPQKISGDLNIETFHLVVDSSGIPHLAFALSQGFDGYYMRGTSNGSWLQPEVIATFLVSEPHLLVDSNGAVHIVWKQEVGQYPDPIYFALHYRMRHVNGNWSAPQIISQGSEDVHHPILVAGPSGNVHLAWTQGLFYFRAVPYYARLYNNGWSAPETIPSGQLLNRMQMVVGPNDVVHILWSQSETYHLQRNANGQWSWPTNVSENNFFSSMVQGVVDDNGRLAAVWSDRILAPQGHETTGHIRVRWREADGRWGAIHSVSPGMDKAFDPQPVLDNNNQLHVVWHDGAIEYTGQDKRVFYTGGALSPETGFSAVSQTVTVSPTLATPTLSFLYNLQGAMSDNDTIFTMSIADENEVITLLTTSDNSSAWQHRWFDMTPWTGQTISVTFALAQTAGKPVARLYLDEVTLGSTYQDLWVAGDKRNALPGEQVVYTLQYGNQGGATADNVQLIHTLPPDLEFVTASVSPIETSPAIVWDVGTLAAKSGPFSLVVTAVVAPTAVPFATLTAPVEIGGSETELEMDNNSAVVKVFTNHEVYLPIAAR